MKKELIKTTGYLLVVDDSEIKVGDYRVNIQRGYVKLADREGLDYYNKRGDIFKKAIAHLPLNNSPILEGVPLLPPLEVEDDEKILFANEIENMLEYDRGRWYGRIEGYNKAREKYKYTEEDVRFMIIKSFLLGVDRGQYSKELEDKLIISLSQPKMPTHFEFEMEDNFSKNDGEYIDESGAKGNYYTHSKIIKTTTNSQGQVIACGKYIY